MLTIGGMWGTLQYKVKSMSDNVKDLNKSIHNGITGRQIKMEAGMESIERKVDGLSTIPERVARVEARCALYHEQVKNGVPDPKA